MRSKCSITSVAQWRDDFKEDSVELDDHGMQILADVLEMMNDAVGGPW
jgi:hypothetical protein